MRWRWWRHQQQRLKDHEVGGGRGHLATVIIAVMRAAEPGEFAAKLRTINSYFVNGFFDLT